MLKTKRFETDKLIGEKLKSFRIGQDMTLQGLSDLTGMSVSSLSRNETGGRGILLVEAAIICAHMGSKEEGVARFVEVVMLVSQRSMLSSLISLV